MNENKIDEKLESILKDIFQIKSINLEANMYEIPEWDSLKHIQLITTIEEVFNITLDFADSIEMSSIPIIKSKILEYLNDK